MECPYCNTENRIDRETCYHCGKDISMLRLIANKARHHYNLALEHAERHRYYEAIAELRNALDLDSSLVEAHVVLGTVYARLNQPEEARQEWEKALGADKSFERAHTYLDQMRRIRPYRGVLRRLRLVLAGFAAVVVLCLILLGYLFWPNTPARLLNRAWTDYQHNNLAAAKTTLDELSRPVSDPALELSAQSLSQTLERDFQEAMGTIERFRREDRPYQALEKAHAYLDRTPPEYASQAVDQAVREIRADLVESLRGRITEIGNSSARLDQAQSSLQRFLKAFPKANESDDLVSQYSQAEHRYASQRLDQVRLAYSTSHDYVSALASLRALRHELKEDRPVAVAVTSSPALHDEIEAEIARITAAQFDSLLDQARQAMSQTKLREAAADLDKAAHIPLKDPAKQAQLASLREALAKSEKEWFLARLRDNVADRDWDAALAAADRISTPSLDRETRETVNHMIEVARRARAVDTYYWLMRHADAIESVRITKAEAGDILKRTRIVLRDLPMDLYPAALDDTLFFQATAQRCLGETAKARQTLNRLRRDCPKSRYLALLDPKTGLPTAWERPAKDS